MSLETANIPREPKHIRIVHATEDLRSAVGLLRDLKEQILNNPSDSAKPAVSAEPSLSELLESEPDILLEIASDIREHVNIIRSALYGC